jgi:polyisoprenoid-binding protein YceI
MKKMILTMAIVAGMAGLAGAQTKYFTRAGHVNFFSSTPMEDIKADNHKATSIMDTGTGDIEFSMLIMAFEFEKALMQEHFNENYMESEKFPKATFKGKITNLGKIDFAKDGTYPAVVTGKMTIHGVTKDATANGSFTVKSGKITANSVFNVAPEDYNIAIPGVVKEKIAKDIKVTVDSAYELYKK